jgi:TRAP-type C4-dicarboxylate transport system permease small subunit
MLVPNPPPPQTAAMRFAHAVAQAARLLLGLILLGMVLANVANAIARYGFGAVYIGTDELLVFAMIWMVMIGMVLVTIERSHIGLDIVTARVSPRARLALTAMSHIIIAVAGAYAAWQSLGFVSRIMANQQTSMALAIPMYIPHSALTIGLACTTLVAAVLAVIDLRYLLSGTTPPEPAAVTAEETL